MGIVMPGASPSGSFSIRKPVIPRCGGSAAASVFASTAITPARHAFVTHIFWPLTT